MVRVSYVPVNQAGVVTQLQEIRGASEDVLHAFERGSPEGDGFIAVIENRTFLAECIRLSLKSAFALPVVTYSTVIELEQHRNDGWPKTIILSLTESNNEASANILKTLAETIPRVPVIVLAYTNDLKLVRTVIGLGAKGFIPATMGFEIAIEAVRFVLAGGTYVPMDCLLARGGPGDATSERPRPPGAVTARELAVVQAIRQGKSNKVIAYELNINESTVKVHVRNIMKKLKAKNRTDAAMKSQTILHAGEDLDNRPVLASARHHPSCHSERQL